jgi:hypothetical protein
MVDNKRKTRKVSKRVLKMWNDPQTVWGKNPDLERFWSRLASEKYVVLIYKDKTHNYVNLPKKGTKKHQSIYTDFDTDTNIVAVLSSNMSQDAYEQYLYPKAKDKTVEYVIKHYSKYFKPIVSGAKLRVPH